MKLLFVCVAVCLLIAVSSKSHSKSHSKSQESTEPVYIPFTNEELEAFRTDKTNDLNPSNKHNLNT